MKKVNALNWLESNGIDRAYAEARIKETLRRNRMSYQSLSVAIGEDAVMITSYGYRKNTTGAYVSAAYRSHFGWKNTYYQAAEIKIIFRAMRGENNKEGKK